MEPSAAQQPPVATEFHSAPAANPTPSLAPPPSHPTYAEMITAAISALKEKNGSSKKAIAKYIDQTYSSLPPSHMALLTHNLKRMKNSGHLLMVKKSYILSSTPRSGPLDPNNNPNSNPNDDPSSSPAFKRGPGRPPKAKSMALTIPLVPLYPEVQPQSQPNNNPDSMNSGLVNGSATPKRGPGRPPKPKVVGTELGVLTFAQGTPGPTKDTPRVRGRPKKYAAEAAAPKPPGNSRRGRPPMVARVGGVVGVLGGVGRKRRGRPPKNAAGLLPSRRSTGKPMGRPKKNALLLNKHAAGQVEELMRKLEFMQACIKSAVSVLKPRVSENAVDAVAALQRLEELASMTFVPIPEPPAPALALAPAPAPAPAMNATSASAGFPSQLLTFNN
ncbi:hypothetical protein Nepgr_018916 [Nepenthes gracilis]|uniref:H15 domain-containing protein n=1 Tax=Nepenthes gracilis TaxID=150966 RepID=A0AAD3SSC6_NEPGR|nr:hypothetical protein Nepgr_018916 [Nepenthes gracilis]